LFCRERMKTVDRNYQRELDGVLDGLQKQGQVPSLLLHSCCAPCSSYVLEYLSSYFKITVFYYNPNIFPEKEYTRRVKEQKRLISEMPLQNPAAFLEGKYDSGEFYGTVKGLEQIPEGGERCFACYRLRLREAASVAAKNGFDYFTTTLSISPYKNAGKLNEIGVEVGKEFGVAFLPSDFKKKNGYQRSIELSKDYGLYRQDYCGCVFSKKEAESRAAVHEKVEADRRSQLL